MKLFSSLGIAFCALSVSGCGATDDGSEEQTDTVEPAEDLAEGLGELGCGTVSGYPYNGGVSDNNGTTQVAPNIASCLFSTTTVTSPTNTYGSSSCPKQYILEVRNTLDRRMVLFPGWRGPPLNDQATCTAAKMEYGMYKRSGVAGSWSLHGTTKLHGVWMGSSCQFQYDAGYTQPLLSTRSGSPDSAVTDIRVTAFAGLGVFRVARQRALIDVWQDRGLPPTCQ
jgi:hypothetical protein